jgi:hypothetical protein
LDLEAPAATTVGDPNSGSRRKARRNISALILPAIEWPLEEKRLLVSIAPRTKRALGNAFNVFLIRKVEKSGEVRG